MLPIRSDAHTSFKNSRQPHRARNAVRWDDYRGTPRSLIVAERSPAAAVQLHIAREGLSGNDHLFRFARTTTQKEHARACGIGGLSGYTIHDHRHTAAVHLARAGMPLHLLQQQLGHANISQTMRYAQFHLSYSDVADYFDRVSESLGLQSKPTFSQAPRA